MQLLDLRAEPAIPSNQSVANAPFEGGTVQELRARREDLTHFEAINQFLGVSEDRVEVWIA